MSYATQADLAERYGEEMLIALTDRSSPPTDAIDASVVTRALDDASAAIDGYLKGRYVLPIATTPPLLRDLCLSVAIYKLHRDTTSDKVRNDYLDALKSLAQISSGAIRLDVAGVEPEASGSSGVRTTDRARDFTPENLRGFV